MSSIVVSGDTSGSVTLSAPAVAGSTTLTLPSTSGTILTTASTAVVTQAMLGTNVAGTGPAFSYYLNTAQTGISAGVFTKVLYDTQIFNATSSMFASSRFTPTVAGYYQINGSINVAGALTSSLVSIFKNGNRVTDGTFFNAVSVNEVLVSGIIYCNGSSDYIELYGYITGTSLAFQASSSGSIFNGALIRAG